MHSTHLRKQHITGALAGAAVGDALGYTRQNLSRRGAIARYGKPKLQFRTLAGGIYSSDTHLMLMTAQALLNSRSDLKSLRRAFRSRLSWYPFSLPLCARSTLSSAGRCWLRRVGVTSGVNVDNNAAGATAIFSALAIHGTGHRIEKWVDETTKLTLTHPLAIEGCRVLGVLAHAAATSKREDLDNEAILGRAVEASEQPVLKSKLEALAGHLANKKCPLWVADQFGWTSQIGKSMLPTTVMATYCWLSAPRDFEMAVLSAIALGGDSSSMGAIVGGLVGAYDTVEAVPEQLFNRLGGTPHGPEWITALGERFSHWPHGEYDLHVAPAQSSDAPLQLMRNIIVAGRVSLNRVGRLPRRLIGGS